MTSEYPLKKKALIYLAPRIVKLMISTFGITYKLVYEGQEHLDKLQESGKNWIFSTWHNNILGDSLLLRNQNLVSIVSASKDGMIASKLLELMGYKTIRGSSSKGGAKVLLTMIKELKMGQNGAITPDGPRGPKYILQDGIITIAQKTGVPLIPFHYEATNQWVFEKSWDQHKFPKPFSTLVISIGEPYFVSEKLTKVDFEAARLEFERMMMDNVSRTQQRVNQIKDKK